MDDILVRLQNQPKINGAHPKDIEDAIKEIENLKKSNEWLRNKMVEWRSKIMTTLHN